MTRAQGGKRPAFRSWDSYRKFDRDVQKQQRFAQNAANRKFLAAVRKTSPPRLKRLREGLSLWRAQLGFDWDPIVVDEEEVDAVPGPFGCKRMSPHPDHVGDGRANPRGIAYMYLTEKRDTAIAEVRPWKGAYISVGIFEILRDLTLVDCSLGHPGLDFHWEPPEPAKWDEIVWQDIDRAFATPVDPSSGTAYVPTQILTEVFRDQGYDGVAYRSALGKGRNFVVFDVAATNLIGCQLFRVTDVAYEADEDGRPYGRDRLTKPLTTNTEPPLAERK